MATEFRWFRSKTTGKEGKYPAHFASRPTFEEIGAEDVECDCWLELPVDEDNETFDDLDFIEDDQEDIEDN